MLRSIPALKSTGTMLLLLALGACGNNNNDTTSPATSSPAPTPTTTAPSNTAPTFTSSPTVSVPEGSTATGYTAAATDADGDALTFSASGGADQAAFSIDGTTGVLSFLAAPDFDAPADADANNVYEVQLEVSDGTDSATLDLAVTVTSTNTAPVFTSSAAVTVADGNTASGYTATATDVDGDVLTFGIAGGADAAAFVVDGSTGALSFVTAPDFSVPGDADADNVYQVQLQVSDGAEIALLDVSVTVVERGTLSVDVTFPTPNANLGGIDSTAVTGNVVDSSGLPVDPADIDFVEVGGVVATLDIAVPGRWSATVPVVPGDNVLAIEFHRSDGVVVTSDLPLQNEPVHLGMFDIEIDDSGAAGDRAVVVNSYIDGLLGIDLTSGARTVISDSTTGSGSDFDSPRDVAIDTTAGRALVVDWRRDALMAVDLTTGDRTDVSSPSVGTGIALDGPISVAFDAANNRALVVVSTTTDLIAVDLATGNRSVFSGTGVGMGPAFTDPQDIEVDNVSAVGSRRAYVSDTTLDAIVAIDLTTGDRTILADAANGTGPDVSPESLALDVLNGRILVANLVGPVIVVDISTGDRTLLRDLGDDYGRNSTRPRGIAVDGARNRALIADGTLAAILGIDLASGDKTVVSDNSVGDGPDRLVLWSVDGLALDRAGNRILASHRAADALVGVDLGSGDRSVVSSDGTTVPAVGTGPAITTTEKLTVDADGNRAFMIPNPSAVYAVDLATGDRTIVSDNSSVGTGETFATPQDIAADVANDRLLVLDISKGLLNVDLLSGDRTVLSSAGVGTGPALTNPTALEGDFPTDVAYTLDWLDDVLLSVDLTTGNRTTVSDNAGTGAGPIFSIPEDMAFDADNGRFIVIDRGFPASILDVNLTNGDRTVISSASVGTGVSLGSPYDVAVDVAGNRAFVYDVGLVGIIVVELSTGQRALMSK